MPVHHRHRPLAHGRLVLTNCDAFDQFPPPPGGVMLQLISSPARLWLISRPLRWEASGSRARATVRSSRGHWTPRSPRRWVTPLLTDASVRRDTAQFMRGVRPADLVDVSTRLGRFTRPVLLLWVLATGSSRCRSRADWRTHFPMPAWWRSKAGIPSSHSRAGPHRQRDQHLPRSRLTLAAPPGQRQVSPRKRPSRSQLMTTWCRVSTSGLPCPGVRVRLDWPTFAIGTKCLSQINCINHRAWALIPARP